MNKSHENGSVIKFGLNYVPGEARMWQAAGTAQAFLNHPWKSY